MQDHTRCLADEKRLRTEATELLASTEIIATLAGLGDISIGGAFAYRVMVAADIDIEVKLADIKQPIAEMRAGIFEWLKSCGYVRRVHFSDRIGWQSESKPRGIWVGLDVPFGEHLWRLDIWFVYGDDNRARQAIVLNPSTLDLLTRLTDVTRARVIMLKEHVRRNYQGYCPSALVYMAVLERGIHEITVFDGWVDQMRDPLHLSGFDRAGAYSNELAA